MKRKTCAALLALSGSLIMVFAANVDKCTEKFNKCTDHCLNVKSQCMASGAEPRECDSNFAICSNACNKALKDCQAGK